jgi:glycosyltransferase involved in cell wall biosynthesis
MPTVAYHSGGVPEIIEHGKTGFLVDVGDTSGVARRLQELLEDRSLPSVWGRGQATSNSAFRAAADRPALVRAGEERTRLTRPPERLGSGRYA